MLHSFNLFYLSVVLLFLGHASASIDIAAYYSISGAFAGSDAVQGWDFWAWYVNETYGGILVDGKRQPVNLKTFDDNSNITVTAQLFQMFVDQGYKFVIGGHTSMADLAGEFFDSNKVIHHPLSLTSSAMCLLHVMPLVLHTEVTWFSCHSK